MLQVTGNRGTKKIENVLFFPFIPSYLLHNLTFKGLHLDIESRSSTLIIAVCIYHYVYVCDDNVMKQI